MLRRKVVYWGKGMRAEEAAELLSEWEIIAVIDNNEKFQGTLWHGVPVISFREYLDMKDPPVVIVTPDKPEEIVKMLLAEGIKRFILFNELIFTRQETLKEVDDEDLLWQKERADMLSHIYYQNWKRERKLCYGFFCLWVLYGSKIGVENKTLEKILNAKHPVINNEFGIRIMETIIGRKVTTVRYGTLPPETDLLLFINARIDYLTEKAALEAMERNIDIVFTEEGFINSIEPFMGTSGEEYTFRHSIIFDEGGLYLNARVPSRIENILNSDWELTDTELARARNLIGVIKKEKLSKYNCQPMGKKIPDKGRPKVLIIDQVFGDKSIEFGMADDEHSFKEMLNAAVRENPDADIYIKAHPVISKGHFADVKETDNIHILSEAFNPVDLLLQMDKAYVVSSQMGFEALMCGCEVRAFGMPFYAGWGVTTDSVKCPRRRKKHGVEEIFYAAYVLSTVYISNKTQRRCEIEDVIDELLELRERYMTVS